MKTIHTEKITYNARNIEIRVGQHDGREEYIVAGFEGQNQKTATYSVSFQTQFDAKRQNGISLVSGLLDVIKSDIERGLIGD